MVQTAAPDETRVDPVGYVWNIVSTATPVALLSLFAIVHVEHWLDSGSLAGLGLALQETVLIVLYLLRRRAKESLNSLGAWIAALLGSYGVLLLRPDGYVFLGAETFIVGLQLFGAALAVIASISLGRSFGIVAANRGVKTDGAYSIVRHPIYASYLLGFLAYLLAAVSLWNVVVLAVTLGFQVRRMNAEESVLRREPEYVKYAERVRYRLIPGIY